MKYIIVTLSTLILLLSKANAEDVLDDFFENKSNTIQQHYKNFEHTDDQVENYGKNANIIVLNKITAKSEIIQLSLDKDYYVGNIKICLDKCIYSALNGVTTDNKAYLTVIEESLSEDAKKIFSGWIFSSSIGLNNMVHPIYQIILTSCN